MPLQRCAPMAACLIAASPARGQSACDVRKGETAMPKRLPHALLVLLLPAGVVCAQDGAAPPTPREASFARADSNGDGRVSPDEHREAAKAAFDAIDADHNYSITTEEIDVASPQRDGELSAAQRIALIDGNDDGILSDDENRLAAEAEFERLDVNGDGALELAEVKSGAPVPVPVP
jgi:hypothetical protein